MFVLFFFFSSRRRHTRWTGDWSSDVCSSDLGCLELRVAEHQQTEARGSHKGVAEHGKPSGRHVHEHDLGRSEERRVGKGVDLGGRRIMKKKKKINKLVGRIADKRERMLCRK